MSLETLLARWQADPATAPNFATWRTQPLRPADLRPLPADLPAPLRTMLHAQGIFELYSHQAIAWEHARQGQNIAMATGTASGKTLAYNLPVLASLLEHDSPRALYLFPTKALTQDQLAVLSNQLAFLRKQAGSDEGFAAAVYDGDTPQGQRKAIRDKARILLTNPDMLHTGILPHHTGWAEFFANLNFVVIDEMHTYRGVFGSHVANVLRRLRRIAQFYGSQPQFILASATIGNPQQLAETLVEAPVSLVTVDGSARGPRHFMIYNPPVTDAALGLRKSAVLESVRLAQDLFAQQVQTVVFARARRTVEMILKYLAELPQPGGQSLALLPKGEEGQPPGIRGYRSGYLPNQRREIERGLRDGNVRTVVATNALELGIDIGGLGAAILVGYPGTVASALQQAGRAGRGLDPAAAILVASPSPLDQFLAHHPDYLFGRSPENALLNPDHLLILLNHLRCAMFELPFAEHEGFGSLPSGPLHEFLEFLVANNESHASAGKYFWMSDAYPAALISLRSASAETFTLQVTTDRPATIGVVDGESALWMTHPGAIYLHEAQVFLVENLDLESKQARLRPIESDYYTEPLRETSVQVLSLLGEQALTSRGEVQKGSKAYGEIQVTTQVTGFRKRRWLTHENLGEEVLELPSSELQTTGYWLALSDAVIETLRAAGAWSNDPNQYGPDWPRLRDAIRARDGYRCQVCGQPETGSRQHDVHHKTPFRRFPSAEAANRPENLITLCPACHRKVEQNVRVRSGLAGLATVLASLAPLFLMCDPGDIGTHIEPVPSSAFQQPAVVLYDQVPAGIGFSQKLFELHDELIQRALELVTDCPCVDGCPSCVGPGGENGAGGKAETLALLRELAK